MSNGIIVITAATGNIGGRLAQKLLAKGAKVRVLGRDATKLESLKQKGAETAVGSVEDAEFVKAAFKGAGAVFTLIPPNPTAQNFRAYQNKVGENYAKAIESEGVQYAVNLSSVGAHLSEKVGPIKGLHDFEQRLNKIKGLNVVHLRPTFFMENALFNVGLIKQAGINGTPMRGDLRFAMIATEDIADAAFGYLSDLKFSGKSAKELLGQRDLTMDEATRILAKAIGKPDLKYVQFPYADAEKAMTGMGMSPDLAASYVEMYKGFNDGIIVPTEKRSASNTGKVAFETFAETIFAKAYLN